MQTSYERMSFTAYLVPDRSGRFFFIVVFLLVLGFCFCSSSCVSMSDITVASVYAATAPFVKYLQVLARPCCIFLSFADHNLPRSLCSEIALPNLDIHHCTKMRELPFPGLAGGGVCRAAVLCAGQWLSSSSSACWAGRQSLVLHWASLPVTTSPKFPAGIPVGLLEQLSQFVLAERDRKGPHSQGSLVEEAAGWLGISFQYVSGLSCSKSK